MSAPSSQRLSYSVEEAADAIGISRNFVGKLVGAGTIPSFLVGRRRLISAKALQTYIANLEAASAPSDGRRARKHA